MSIKYCFQNEIHKKYSFPTDFSALINDITSLFVQKLPTNFLLQYQDSDGDMIAVSNNEEYQTLLKHELPLTSALKLFVIPLTAACLPKKKGSCTSRSGSDGSFEMVEDDDSLKVEEIKELSIPDEETQNNLDSKVVVSLKIPQDNTLRLQSNLLKESECDQKERSFTCSEPENSRVNESRDLVKELSLSLGAATSDEEEEDNSFKAASNKHSKSQDASLNCFRRSLPQNILENKDVQIDLGELKRVDKLEVDNSKELDLEELNRYFSRIFSKCPQGQNADKFDRIFLRDPVEENKNEDEGQERWVSFSSEHEVIPPTQAFELQTKTSFVTKQAPEQTWFTYNKEVHNIYDEKADEDERTECDELSIRTARKKLRRSFGSFEVGRKEINQVLTVLKDEEVEERKGRKKNHKQANADNMQIYDSTSMKDQFTDDIWYDALYNTNMKDDFLQYLQQNNVQSDKITTQQKETLDDLYLNLDETNKENVDRNVEESFRENVENMNLSLLTTSEAKYMASAIGSMHKVKGVEKLKINENTFKDNQFEAVKETSPILNKWVNRRDLIKPQEKEEELSFLKPSDTWKRRESCYIQEKRFNQGSFCMRCWESPVSGPKYVCLVCDDVEYCSKCASEINHIHPLLTIDEMKEQELDLMNNISPYAFSRDEALYALKSDINPREDFDYKEMDFLNKSFERSFSLRPYYSVEKTSDDYKFEYKELSTTPLLVKQNRKEWCVVYKTICLKNTGKCMWMKCHLEPVGVVPGTITEISYLAPGDSALMTLEMHGFFSPGKYSSNWRVVHQGDMGLLTEMGSLDLEFEVLECTNVSLNKQINYDQELQSLAHRKQEFGEDF